MTKNFKVGTIYTYRENFYIEFENTLFIVKYGVKYKTYYINKLN